MSYHFPYAGGRGNAALPDDPEGDFEIDVAMVTPGLLDVLGVPIVEGRDVRRGEGTEVSIVNRTLAERLWPGARAVGRTFVFTGVETRVVGVVERERCDDLLVLPDACAWRPVVRSVGTMTVNIRTVGPAREAIAPLRALVETLGPRMVIVELATMDAFLDDRVQAQRTATVAASALAAFGLGLLVVGCVTLFLSLVRDSRPEIALRMAIGASRVRVARTVVRHGLPIAVLGGGLGMVVAAGVSPLVDDQLVGISATDGWTFLGVTTAVLLLGVTSVGYAALAATRTDPAAFLRGD